MLEATVRLALYASCRGDDSNDPRIRDWMLVLCLVRPGGSTATFHLLILDLRPPPRGSGHPRRRGEARGGIVRSFQPPDLRTLFQASEPAIRLLDVAEANYRSGKVLSWVGFAFVVASGFTYGVFEEPGASPTTGEWAAIGIGITGVGLSLWGGQRLRTARRAVDEGIWFYNGSLPRSP